MLNGIDVTACQEGDVVDVSDQEAQLLIAEGWASPLIAERTIAHDRPPRREKKTREKKSR